MATIISVEQGGTGVQSVQKIKEKLGLKSAAYLEKTDSYTSDSHETIPTSYALSKISNSLNTLITNSNSQFEESINNLQSQIENVENSGIKGIISVSQGGTGATTPEVARQNLGIELPLSVENGGTGATTQQIARENLGIMFPLPIEQGGTGSTNIIGARQQLGIDFPLSIENGGTGSSSLDELKRSLNVESVDYPLSIGFGGTGGVNKEEARENLGIKLPLPIESGGTGGETSEQAIENIFGHFPLNLSDVGLGNPIQIDHGGTGVNTLEKLKYLVGRINLIKVEQLNNLNELTDNGFYLFDGSMEDIKELPSDKLKEFVLISLGCEQLNNEEIENPSDENEEIETLSDEETENPSDENNEDLDTSFDESVYTKKIEKGTQILISLGNLIGLSHGQIWVRHCELFEDRLVWYEWKELGTSNVTISSSAPSGGKSGDIWYQYID